VLSYPEYVDDIPQQAGASQTIKRENSLEPLVEPINPTRRRSEAMLSYLSNLMAIRDKSKQSTALSYPTSTERKSTESNDEIMPIKLKSTEDESHQVVLSYPENTQFEPIKPNEELVPVKLGSIEDELLFDTTNIIPKPAKSNEEPVPIKLESKKDNSNQDAFRSSSGYIKPEAIKATEELMAVDSEPTMNDSDEESERERVVLDCVVNDSPVPNPSVHSFRLPRRPHNISAGSERNQIKKTSSLLDLQDEENISEKEEMDIDLPRGSHKRKAKQQDDISNDKPQKVKEQDDIDAEKETEAATSSSDILPTLPYDPIDDYEVQAVGADEHWLTYPFPVQNSVVVYKEDMIRLNEDTYLNDTLLEVFPKIWADEFPSASIHMFSPFFYTKLTDTKDSAINYGKVRKWTKDEDIFKKKLLIIPMHQSSHWYILLVTNPGYCIQGAKGAEYHEHVDYEQEQPSSSNGRPTRKTRVKKMIYPGTELNPQK
jgi:hypothetical protein